MYKLLSIILLCLSVLSMNTAHANAQPKPDIPDGEVGDWRKTPGALRPAPDKIIPFPKPAKPQKVHVPFDVKKIGKYLGKGGAALLPALAYELLDGAVDYFLDPDNNRATYYPQGNCTSLWRSDLPPMSKTALGDKICGDSGNGTVLKFRKNSDTQFSLYCTGGWGESEPFATISCPIPELAEIPLDELATRLIEAARRGNPDAIRALERWADDEVNTNPDAYRRQLESTDPKVNPNIDPNSETNPEDNPSADVCQTGYTKDKDGVCVPDKQETEDEEESPEEEPKPDDGECPLPKIICDFLDPTDKEKDTDYKFDAPAPTINTTVRFGGSCPANSQISFGLSSFQVDLVLMDWTRFCGILSSYVKPILIAIASYLAVLIVAGRNESN